MAKFRRRSRRELRDDKLGRRQLRHLDRAVARGQRPRSHPWVAPYGRPRTAVPEDYDG